MSEKPLDLFSQFTNYLDIQPVKKILSYLTSEHKHEIAPRSKCFGSII